ncbi:MAG: transporter substrate-binding domain-containing protein [Alphaproteobacteria bacterium]|nr:transporter substrate-binding domain-containing protein [Alphaproteobacteria bacterium]
MKLSQLVLVVALAAVTSFGVVKVAGSGANGVAQDTKKETAFERVMTTNTLKCAYLVAAPQLTRDPNTGELSGLSYDIMVEAAKRLNLTVEWTEEVSFATFAEGLKTKRYDAFCFTAYRWSPWARIVEYARPVYFSTTDVYVREDDTRFDGNLAAINDPAVTVATIDSSGGHFLRNEQFPQSKNYSMAADTNLSLVLEALATNKADVTISNPLVAMPYLVANPGKVRRVRDVSSLRAYGHAFSFAKGEQDLRNMFDVVFDEMLTDGTINKILDKYEKITNSFIRIKSPVAPAPEKETP